MALQKYRNHVLKESVAVDLGQLAGPATFRVTARKKDIELTQFVRLPAGAGAGASPAASQQGTPDELGSTSRSATISPRPRRRAKSAASRSG